MPWINAGLEYTGKPSGRLCLYLLSETQARRSHQDMMRRLQKPGRDRAIVWLADAVTRSRQAFGRSGQDLQVLSWKKSNSTKAINKSYSSLSAVKLFEHNNKRVFKGRRYSPFILNE
ncbi:unnamed protein product [Microthlaspi erraticum]|uniref:Uncharacterized protein n=1 Tax=Microthlaspi erraticum TaxID=1685480 RepID=A0A6D2HJM0_9BRAS|nr:unnamed protein product [Microthlaspi erraticum]